MEEIVRTINNTNLNSCELGKSIVNSGASKFSKGAEIVCIRQQMERNLAKDIAEARENCTSGGQKTSTLNSSTEPKDAAIVDINYAWNAISKTSLDKEMKEFIQTITGTIIVIKGANDNSPAIVKIYPSLATDSSTFNALLYGGSMKKYSCDEVNKCLNISDSGTHKILTKDGFYNKINTALKSVASKMITRDKELTDEESEMLSTTDTSVITILRTYQSYYPKEVDSMISNSLTEIVAHDLLNDFIIKNLEAIKKISQQNSLQVDETKIKNFQASIEKAQFNLNKIQHKMQRKRETLSALVLKTQEVEKAAKDVFVGKMYN